MNAIELAKVYENAAASLRSDPTLVSQIEILHRVLGITKFTAERLQDKFDQACVDMQSNNN